MGRTTGSGQGSVYKRGDKWRGQITIDGKRHSFTAKKKADVNNWLAKMKVIGAEDVQNTQAITVKQISKKWLKVRETQITPQTIRRIDASFEKHLYPILGDVELTKLTKKMIEGAYPLMFEPGEYSYSTVILFKSRFKAVLNYAVDEGFIQNNPHERVSIPKYKDPEKIDAYTAEDQKKIVKYLKDRLEPPEALFYLLISTGMRVGEAAALTWDDVDLKKGAIDINKTIVVLRGTKIIQHHPKTAAGVRTILLPSKTLTYLRKYKQKYNNQEYVFLNTRGGLFDSARLGHHWTRICAKIGVERKRIHALRHTFATRALEKQIDVKVVSKIVGHSSVITTMNVYQDVYIEQKRKAANIINSVV